jgi:sugar lactone lactonase YvrE
MASQRFFLIFTACLLSILVLSGGAVLAEAPPNFALKWGTPGSADGQFNRPRGLAADSSGNLYVADTENHRIQKFSSTGAFISKWGTQGTGNGQFNKPYDVAVDNSGNIFVADTNNHRIQKLSSTGDYIVQWGGFGTADGQFSSPYSVATDSAGNVYVADTYNNRIQKFNNSGIIIGKWGTLGSGDGQLNMPFSVAADNTGSIYVADTYNNRIQKFGNTGTFIAKWGDSTQFNSPSGLATDSAGNIFVADKDNNRIKKFDSAGNLLAAWGSYGSADGQFIFPWGILPDSSGNVYVADTENHRIQKFAYPFTPTRIIALNGDMGFGNVTIGSTLQKTLTISNSGNSALTVNSITYPAGFSGNWSGTIAAGSSQSVSVTFTPTAAQSYTGTLTVNSDKTDGTNTISVSGTGINVQTELSATRYIPCYVSISGGNYKITVTLTVIPISDTKNYAIEELIPGGWSISNISDGGVYDSFNEVLKFGPFLDNLPRTLSYEIISPATETFDNTFYGIVSPDGGIVVISGDNMTIQCSSHPADINTNDFWLSIDEITEYGAAWRSGTNWRVHPNSIPIEYVSRSGVLWKGGEAYKYDPTAGEPPWCWVNNTDTTARSLRADDSSTIRKVVPTTDNTSFTVSLVVTPSQNIQSYAVEDQLPEGWDVSEISDNGHFDAKSRKVRFGPFMDNQPRTLSYRLKSLSGASDAPVFSGIASFNGVNVRIQSVRGGPQEPVPGDIDGNPGVTLSDAVLALKVLVGTAPEIVVVSGDVNQDQKIGLQEAIYILQTVAGLR